jgi:Cys-tRNA(Pro)/Cys-tRNA(Cys) deacylase
VTAQDYKTIYISAGRRGLEVEITATDLGFLTQGKFVALGNKK